MIWQNFLNTESFVHYTITSQIEVEDQKTKRSEDQVILNKDLPILRSSTLDIASTTKNKKIIELPKQYNLAVPFTSQAPEKNWDQPWQDACEEAALLMLDAYYKNYKLSPLFAKDEILKMVKWEENKGWGRSIEIEKIKQVAEEYLKISNFQFPISKLVIIENPTVEDIKKSIANDNPVLVVADGKALPNPHFQNGGPEYHALIIRGYTETKFITNDPGTQFGEAFEYEYDDLMDAIRDWNNGDVKNGRRVILVIE
ncbi:MAG: C39 family peptidase [Candidatus Magasanikiibacteriota bacterium]